MKEKFLKLVGLASILLALYMVSPFRNVLVYAVFIYYIARPVHRILDRWIKSGPSAFISLFLLVLPVVLIIIYTLAVASVELMQFMSDSSLPYADQLTNTVSGLNQLANEIQLEDALELARDNTQAGTVLVETLLSGLGLAFRLFIVFTIAFYLLRDGSRLSSWTVNNLSENKELMKKFFNDVDQGLHQVFFGNILNAALISVLGSVLFTILNEAAPLQTLTIPHPLLLGLLCGLTSLIPVVGVALVWLPLTIYLLAQAYLSGFLFNLIWFPIVTLVLTAVMVDWVPNVIVKPHVVRGKMHTGLLMMSYIFGPLVFGLSGILIGPMVTVIAYSFMKTVLPELRKTRAQLIK